MSDPNQAMWCAVNVVRLILTIDHHSLIGRRCSQFSVRNSQLKCKTPCAAAIMRYEKRSTETRPAVFPHRLSCLRLCPMEFGPGLRSIGRGGRWPSATKQARRMTSIWQPGRQKKISAMTHYQTGWYGWNDNIAGCLLARAGTLQPFAQQAQRL